MHFIIKDGFNFLDCDWSKKLLFFTYSQSGKYVIGQFLIGQFVIGRLNRPITFKVVVYIRATLNYLASARTIYLQKRTIKVKKNNLLPRTSSAKYRKFNRMMLCENLCNF